ncbi:protein HESO1 [Melia azedarach]|uniref:Protein HESO1 n=1 Tax=Melia azedarach TaxID=155640 RepID=A0ACC1Y8C3_MELAZ|nr:protein HESO1 [Melia azedarach]
MSSFGLVEPTLKDILSVINPLREDWDTRFRLINDLREVVESVESFRGAVVEPFGSFVSNLFSRWGDLDISIELSNGSCISSAGKKRKQSLLGDLLKALRQRGGFCRLQYIPNARVPILKFESSGQNISCDVSIDNLCGQMKSKFLFWISEMDGRFRDMVLLVKEWAKAHGINNPKSGTLNSYSLSLLVIFHFQTCEPAILPPLKVIYPGNLVDDLKGTRASAERQIAEIYTANIARFRSDKYRPINRSSLARLFISFFEKFSGISLKASELGICPFTGQWEHIGSNTRWLPNTHPIFIEDPFEQPENTARAVSKKQLAKISKAIETTHSRLTISAKQSRCHLLSTLARPHITQFITGTPVRYPNYNGGQFRTSPQNHKVIYSASQAQHQPHNARPENRPNRFISLQPVQQLHSQSFRPHQGPVQQRWRPKSDASQSSSGNEDAET